MHVCPPGPGGGGAAPAPPRPAPRPPPPPPPPPPPHPGSAYETPMMERVLRLIPLPSSFVIVQVSPRLREMNNSRPPTMIVAGLCGDSRIGEFQLKAKTEIGR